MNTPSNASSRVPQYGRQWGRRGDKGKQGETSGHTIQHRHTYVGRQWETMGDKTSGRRTQHLTQAHMWETMEHKRRQGETRPREGGHTIQHPAHVTKQMETGGGKPREDGHTIQHRHTCAETMRGNHPTQTHMWGGNGRQEEARPRDGRRTFHKHNPLLSPLVGAPGRLSGVSP